MCAPGHREDAPKCSIPPDTVSAFGVETTSLPFREANLVGELFPTNFCAGFPELETLELGQNSGVDAGPVPSWLSECMHLQNLRLDATKRNGNLANAIANLVRTEVVSFAMPFHRVDGNFQFVTCRSSLDAHKIKLEVQRMQAKGYTVWFHIISISGGVNNPPPGYLFDDNGNRALFRFDSGFRDDPTNELTACPGGYLHVDVTHMPTQKPAFKFEAGSGYGVTNARFQIQMWGQRDGHPLNILALSHNRFDNGPVPVPEIALLSKLENLGLRETNRNGNLEDALKKLGVSNRRLQWFWLGLNDFDAGPIPLAALAPFENLGLLDLLRTKRSGDMGTAVKRLVKQFNNTLVNLWLGDNPFDAGPIPKTDFTQFAKLDLLSIANTNRHGTLGSVQFPPSLKALEMNNNPALEAGPLPKSFQKLTKLQELEIADANRYGAVNADACGLAVAAGEPCVCTPEYTGDRCETCIGCAAGMMCGSTDTAEDFQRVRFAVVKGNDLADDVYWNRNCKSVPIQAGSLVMEFAGTSTDYFKPVQGASFCDMLTSHNKHQWSADGVEWMTPAYYIHTNHFGGSAENWPLNSVPGDPRRTLPFWGARDHKENPRGGYAHGLGWNAPFTMAYFVRKSCMIPPDPASAFGHDAKSIVYDSFHRNYYDSLSNLNNPSLVGTVPDLGAELPLLEVLNLNGNPGLSAGPLWPWLKDLGNLRELHLQNTKRNGPLGAAHLPNTLQILNVFNNPFDKGPVPASFSDLKALKTAYITKSNRVGFSTADTIKLRNIGQGYCRSRYIGGWDMGQQSVQSCTNVCAAQEGCTYFSLSVGETCSRYSGGIDDCMPLVGFDRNSKRHTTYEMIRSNDACAVAFAQENSCSDFNLCSEQYTGRRCETCIGCKQSLMCSESLPGACQIPDDVAAAFGRTIKTLDLSYAKLTGGVPEMLTLTDLERLDVSHNPNLAPSQDWTWIESLPNLKDLNLVNSSQQAPYGHVCSGGGSQACLAGSTCRTHCCKPDVADGCQFCTDDGSCYAPLELSSARWNASTTLTDGWLPRYNKDEKLNIPGPTEQELQELLQLLTKNNATLDSGALDRISFTLAWGGEDEGVGGGGGGDGGGGDDDETGSVGNGAEVPWTFEKYAGRPPPNLFASDAGRDPGVFDADLATGSIVGVPQKNGKYTVWLLLEHRDEQSGLLAPSVGLPKELDQVVLKRWSFEVIGKPDFAVLRYNRPAFEGAESNGGDAGQESTPHPVSCIVGETARIGPLDVGRYHQGEDLEHFSGNPEKITFTLTNSPAGFFISPKTGEMQAVPERAGVYDAALWASDESGATSFIETLRIAIADPKEFGITATAWNASSNTVTASFEQVYTRGIAYSFDGPELSKSDLFQHAAEDDYDAIIYKLDFADGKSPGKMFVDTGSGEMLMNPTEVGNFTVTLSAVDRKGASVTVATVSFEVKVVQDFKLSSEWNPAAMVDGIQPLYQTNAFHDIQAPRLSKSELFEGVESGDPTKVAYALELFDSVDADTLLDQDAVDLGKFFVAQSGEMYIKPTAPGSYVAKLIARDTSGQSVVVKAFAFEARPDDVLDSSNGPNRKGCGEHGTAVDLVELDYSFECTCSDSTFSGANCEIYQPLAAGVTDAAQDSGPIIGGALGGLILVMFVVVLVFRRRAYRHKMKAVDFASALRSLLEDGEINEDQVHDQNMPREIRRRAVTLSNKIGSGAFGDVFKAILDESASVPGYMVAVKTSNVVFGEGADDLIKEVRTA